MVGYAIKMKDLVKLPFIKSLDNSLTEKNGLLQVIIGARQVGKTTTILKYLNEHHSNNFHFHSADEVFNASAK